MCRQMEALRSFEAEVVQLRGLTHELMRELRVGTRQVELCRAQEARTAEENRRLSELINKHNSAVNSIQKVVAHVLRGGGGMGMAGRGDGDSLIVPTSQYTKL